MIEQIINSIIKELGVTGILVASLAWISYTSTKKIIAKMNFLNDELSQIIELMKKQEKNQRQK